VIASLVACQPTSPTPISPTPTRPEASLTPVPMAILINGSGITQVEYQAELARFQAAQLGLGNVIPPAEASQRVLDDLTNQVLLEQGAQALGFVVEDAMLQARIESLAAQIGGMQVLATWEETHGYSDESLRQSLRRQIASAWMRDEIISKVPGTAEQVHVQQILLSSMDKAQAVWNDLNSGTSFSSLAAYYDPVTKGELGWFPRNYLPDIQIEEAAFALQPNQFSNVIQTQAGYSILYVLEREIDHILSPDALLTLQTVALENWVMTRRQNSIITLNP
jgi:parvulin-like peptidyl-prolyl isomerase